MVNIARKENHEVGMHSNVIYSLINPHGLHYQGDLFLGQFIEKVLGFNKNEGSRLAKLYHFASLEPYIKGVKKMDTALKSIIILVSAVIVLIVQGYILSVTWGWFIVPIFGVPTLGMGYAVGLILVVFQFHVQKTSIDDPFDNNIFMKILYAAWERIVDLVVVFFFAWMTKSFLL